ncbi:hypothetical protein K450DRAFT_254545 [Umbelopsis ramanniana AG]|uniref:Uncharacterized protein n=1 Tax=Umbelopsis ramanniana AG TaxID=1314678 RepID=A0AAD5E562_UMBRA|nr:uncharacterized protein K450DRAFT_254545 [Umbelopsis ramanniana AG]KAI8576844.1 hypothetical protein K450DRAFT_254545 [Umbelopsis ramanniana AG]
MASSATLSNLADQYSREFSECLSTILPDTPDKINDSKAIHKDIATHIAAMKATTSSIEEAMGDIRLELLKDKEVALEQSLALLRRDIHVKTETIDKYTTQLEKWSSELLKLGSKGREVAKREHERYQVRSDNDHNRSQVQRHDSDDDMSDKDMFEEVV